MDLIGQALKRITDTASTLFPQPVQSPVPSAIQPQDNFISQLGRSPIGQAIVGAQKFIESPQSIAPVPQVKPFDNSIPGQVGNFAANVPGGIVNSFISPIANLGSDFSQTVGRTIGGRGAVPYQNLKSPIARLEYNALGVKNTPQEILGNVAGTGGDLLNYALPGGAEAVAKDTAEQGIMQGIKSGAVSGAKFMGAQGALQGISEGRNAQNMWQQLYQGIQGGVTGATTGAVMGGTLGGGSAIYGKILGAVQEANPTASPAEVQAKTVSYIKDKATGKFISKDTFQPQGMTPSTGKLQINDWRAQVDKKLGIDGINPQGGFIKPDEFIPSKPQLKVKGGMPTAQSIDKEINATDVSASTQDTNHNIPGQEPFQPKSQSSEPIIAQKAPLTSSPDVQNVLENARVVEGKPAGDNPLNGFKPNAEPTTADIQNTFRDKRGNFDFQRDVATRQSDKAIKTWDSQPQVDQLSFMQRVQNGEAQPTPELQAAADNFRQRFDADYEIGKSVNPNLNYKQDYFTKSGIWANPDEARQFFNQWQKQKLAATPGSFKEATIPTIYDGVKAGLQLKETNPETLYLNNHIQVLKAKMAGDFQAAMEAKGADPVKVQKFIDQYMDRGLRDNTIYKSIRSANAALNSVNLGLSGFHIGGTAINATISKTSMGLNQLLTGHPIEAAGSFVRAPTAALEYVFKGNKIINDKNAGNLTPDIQNIIGGGGRIGTAEYKTSGLANAIEDFKRGNYITGAAKVPFGIVNTMAKPIMEYWVPRLKAGAAADLISTNLKHLGPDATPEQISAVRSSAIDSIDNRFGQLVQDNIFWNKSLKDVMALGMRSPGWNIGTVRELGLGARDLFDVKRLLSGGGVSDRAAYTLALPMVVGLMGAAYQYLKTGQGSQEPTDYFYPKTGEVDQKTGKPERVSFPTYAKDVYAFMHNPLQTAVNKESPMLNEATKQLQNKDYLGNPIYDPNAPVLTQLRQRGASAVMGNLPFSLTTASNRMNPTPETGAESFFGVNKAPGSITGGYYDAKAAAYSKLDPNQKTVMDYITQPSSQGGPSSSDKAAVLFKNQWAIPVLKDIQTTSNPKDPLWSRPLNEIQDYLAYQATTDSSQKAQLRLKDPWINGLKADISLQIGQAVAASTAKKADQTNSLTGKLGSMLGVYNPPPLTPSQPYNQAPPRPYDTLQPQYQRVADAYTAAAKGSVARQQLLAQNPWLKTYWNAQTAYYNQYPIQNNSPVNAYLASQGINPATNVASGGFGYSGSSITSPMYGANKIKSQIRSSITRTRKYKVKKAVKAKLSKTKMPKTPKLKLAFGRQATKKVKIKA